MGSVLPTPDPFAGRRYSSERPDSYRTPYERDTDRLLYSSAFRRLSGITQVVSADETLLFHNRLTHTLKVAQVSRSISDRLCSQYEGQLRTADGLDATAAVAAAMAHDLGHPPFGHIAEEVLRDLCDKHEIGGYEGNAQTFRIVTRLAWRTEDPGLNLTRRTLRGILKYPWKRTGHHADGLKWGAYETEHSDFSWAQDDGHYASKSLEAQIMDWADDITYAVHDLEDFHRAGLTPVARLHTDDLEQARFISKTTGSLQDKEEFDADELAGAFSAMMNLTPFDRPYEGTNSDRRLLHSVASTLISRFIEGTKLASDGRSLDIPTRIWHEVNLLKQLTWHYVINSPDLATIQEGQKEVIRSLFKYLSDWADRENKSERLPTRYREIIHSIQQDEEARSTLGNDRWKIITRAACDYIASLTEAQALELHGRLCGNGRASVLHGWVGA